MFSKLRSEDKTGRARAGTVWLLLLCALFPAAVASAILYSEALPHPYQDDYHAIVAFATGYQQLPGLQPRLLDIVKEQHNEYKLAFEHAVVAAELETTHQLNFAFLTALGDFFLLPLGYLLWLTYAQDSADLSRRLLAFLPISFLFFALTYWENLNWATTGLQNTPVVLFSLLAIFLIAPVEQAPANFARVLLGCLAASLAAFTSANGFLLGPIGLLIFLIRRQFGWAAVWCASFVLPLAAYLYRYVPVPHAMDPHYYLTRPLFFLAFLGSVAGSRWPAACLGLLILLLAAIAVRSRFDRVNPVAFYFTLWILATAGLVSWVRGAAGFIIGSRYSMYSILLIIFCYSFLTHCLPARWPRFRSTYYYATAIFLAVCYCAAADVHAWKKLSQRRQMVLAGLASYRRQPAVNSPMVDANIDIAAPGERAYEREILTRAIAKGLYSLPPQS